MSIVKLKERAYFPAAVAVNGSFSPVALLNITSGTDNPSVAAVVGTNTLRAVLNFPDANIARARLEYLMPEDWHPATGIEVRLLWATPATTGAAHWVAEAAITVPADATLDSGDPTYDASIAADVSALSSASKINLSSLGTLTPVHQDASAVVRPLNQSLLLLRISRLPADAGDTIGNTASLIGVEIRYHRQVNL